MEKIEIKPKAKWEILKIIENEGKATTKSIMEKTGCKWVVVERYILTLRNYGLIKVSRNPENRRESIIELTEKGKVFLEVYKITERHIELLNKILNCSDISTLDISTIRAECPIACLQS